MKLNKGFLTHTTKGEHYMISTGNTKFNGIVKNNDTAAFIIEYLKTDTTPKEIVEKVMKEFSGAERKTVEHDVIDILKKLNSIGAIDK